MESSQVSDGVSDSYNHPKRGGQGLTRTGHPDLLVEVQRRGALSTLRFLRGWPQWKQHPMPPTRSEKQRSQPAATKSRIPAAKSTVHSALVIGRICLNNSVLMPYTRSCRNASLLHHQSQIGAVRYRRRTGCDRAGHHERVRPRGRPGTLASPTGSSSAPRERYPRAKQHE
jgi:hypothetical protein